MKAAGILLTLLALMLLAPGCSEDGSAEEAGERIDQAVEDTGEAIDAGVWRRRWRGGDGWRSRV